MFELISYFFMGASCILLFALILVYRKNVIAKSLLKEMVDEKIEAYRKGKFKDIKSKISITYSYDSLADIESKEIDFEVEMMAINLNAQDLSRVFNTLRRKHNSRLIYYSFLDEITGLLEKSNVEVNEVIERFEDVSPEELLN
jgi:hypothetical protein